MAADPVGTTEGDRLVAAADPTEPGECRGTDKYTDLAGGAPVVVRDATLRTVGAGELEPGRFAAPVACAVAVALPAADLHWFAVGERQPEAYHSADLAAQGFRLDLALGDPGG